MVYETSGTFSSTTAQAGRSAYDRTPGELRTWQQRAELAEQHAEHETIRMMQAELAARIAAVTGRHVMPELVYVNQAARLAIMALDGMTFRLRGDQLVVMRWCTRCASTLVESPPVRTAADLAGVLDDQEPRCIACAG